MNKCEVYMEKYLVTVTLEIEKKKLLSKGDGKLVHTGVAAQIKMSLFLEGKSSNLLDAISPKRASLSGTNGIFNLRKTRSVCPPPFVNSFCCQSPIFFGGKH